MSIAALIVLAGIFAAAQPEKTPNPSPAAASQPAQAASAPFRVETTFNVGGEGGWDLLAVDPDAHRLYVPRGTRVMVIDTVTGASVGEIAETAGVHGVALAPALNRGFTSNGKAGTVTVFDLMSLATLLTVKAGENPDAILFEPVTKTVLCFNGKSKDATVINAADGEVLGTIALGGQPELPVADGAGKVFVNTEDTSEVLRIDVASRTVEARFPLAPGEGPTGLAFDASRKHLFAACANEKLIVLDATTGKVLATPAIGKGVDGADFDAVGGFAMTSNGSGTLSIVSAKDDKFEVVQTLPTGTRARTMVIDPKSQRVYLPSAEFEAPKEAPKGGARQRPAMKSGTFKIIVVGPAEIAGGTKPASN